MDYMSKEWIALQEKASQEDVSSLLEIIAQFYNYRDRAQYDNRTFVTVDLQIWQLHLTALVNIAGGISGNIKQCHNLLRMVRANQKLIQLLSERQIEKISNELLELITAKQNESVNKQ